MEKNAITVIENLLNAPEEEFRRICHDGQQRDLENLIATVELTPDIQHLFKQIVARATMLGIGF